jgi:hypothetical protein
VDLVGLKNVDSAARSRLAMILEALFRFVYAVLRAALCLVVLRGRGEASAVRRRSTDA